jgi:hypothetical protein
LRKFVAKSEYYPPRVHVDLSVCSCVYVWHSANSDRHIFVKLFLVTLLKIVSNFEFLQKSKNYDALVDTYMYLLCYLAAIGFIIHTDCVLCEVGAEQLNLTITHD